MSNNFIETVLSTPNEEHSSCRALININHIVSIQEDESDKTTWIITDSSEHHDILHSLECYDAFRNGIEFWS